MTKMFDTTAVSSSWLQYKTLQLLALQEQKFV